MSQSGWYYTSNGQRVGPIAVAQLQQMTATGQIRPDDLVWTEGMTDWQPANTIPGLFPTAPAQPAYYPQQPNYAQAPSNYVPPPQYYGGQAPAPGQSYQGFAIAGFVLSFFGFLAVLGFIFSMLALSGMKRTGNTDGKGLAIAGVVISSVVCGLFCLYVIGIASCLGANHRF